MSESTAKPSAAYEERLGTFESVMRDCIGVSRKCMGIRSPTAAHYHASVLFTTLCTRAVSFAFVLPHCSWATRKVDHWDYASLSVLTRSLLEVRFAFSYLCIEECDEAEWNCRLNILNLHDCTARIHMFEEMEANDAGIPQLQESADQLKERLENNGYFQGLPGKEQRKYLRGKTAYVLPLEEIAESCGIGKTTFRWLYKFLSSHVHGFPMSYYRMGPGVERGRGLHSVTEEHYCQMCLSLVITAMSGARDEMATLFGVSARANNAMPPTT